MPIVIDNIKKCEKNYGKGVDKTPILWYNRYTERRKGDTKLIEFIVYFLNQIDLPMLMNDLRISIDLFKMLIGKG